LMSAGVQLRDLALENLEEVAPSAQKVAVCQQGPSVYGKQDGYDGYDILVVCKDFADVIRAQVRVIGKTRLRYLLVEKNLVESDVMKGTLGDFLTERFLYPYRAIVNSEYLDSVGFDAKSRIVREEVKRLVVEYGEMCRGLVVKPEFFALSRMRTRARVLLPSMDEYIRLLEPEVRQKNLALLRDSYNQAIAKLPGDIVQLEGENVTIPDSTVDRWLKDRASEQVVDIIRQGQRAFYSYVVRGRAIFLNLELLARELYGPIKFGVESELVGREIEDPKNYLYLRTAEGLISLNEKSSLADTVAKLRPGNPVTVSPLAGVLNEVFLVTSGREQFVAKHFTDWHGFKWFTLNLVSFGSKFFAVSGKTRMTNEYGINRYLAKKGLNVPQIFHASVKQRILLESYISGSSMKEFVAETVDQRALTHRQYRLAEQFGETLASIHDVGVTIGDSKPENFVATEKEIYTVDLEQAGKRGDYAWDIAELLFYTGHYSNLPSPTRGLSEMIDAFIHGYLGKGNASELKRAAGVRYAKAFSLWTPAPIILEISRKLREAK
jgi:tRNA A-37 threonylcarbamoyl transferase component Bud32